MNEIQLVALVVALTELLKGYLPSKKLAPLLALVLGVLGGLYMNPTLDGALMGLAWGLGTTGLYKTAYKFINK